MNSILIAYLVSSVAPAQITIHNYSSVSNNNLTRTYALAKQIFIDVTGCDAPVMAELTIRDVPFVELNRDQAMFVDGGISVVMGLYILEDKSIEISAEHPDKEFVLFHELAHFFFSHSVRCRVFASSSKVQHAYIATFENMFVDSTKRSRSKLNDTDWIIEVLKKNGINLESKKGIK